MILTGKNWRTRRKPHLSAALRATNPTLTGLGLNTDLHGERPANNRLSQNWSNFWRRDSWNSHEHSSTLRLHCGWYLTRYIDVYTSTKQAVLQVKV